MIRKLFSVIILFLALSFFVRADNTKYVNCFMGTAGDHGQVTPAAQYPLGLASVCPDSTTPSHGGYDYNVASISGISTTRISGVGGNGGGGNISVRPCSLEETLEIVKGSEKAHPGYYEALLSNGVKLFLTANHNTAVERYIFPAGAKPRMFVDFNSAIDPRRSECKYKVLDNNNIEGWAKSSTVCNFGACTLYFRLHSDIPFKLGSSDETTAVLDFDEGTREVEIRIALSPIDEKTAGKEFELCASDSFDKMHTQAQKAWSDILDRVDVWGSTQEQRILFYTSLYRVYLSPMNATSFDGRYRGTDGQIHSTEGKWTYYSSWSMWDSFRTKFPMFCLLSPDMMSDMCRSLVSLYCTGKKNWATMNECVPTVRTEHSQLTLLDAWSKGIRGFDMAKAFPAMEQEVIDGAKSGSRQGLTMNSPDQKMETIYDLWAMGQIASVIGNTSASEKYTALSKELFEQTWKKEFMTITDKFALMKGNGMYQGTRWQYRWAMPIYIDRMIELKGKEVLSNELSEFFARHLFNQGNEPDIQTPFMFNLLGNPERTDSLVNALITDEKMVHLYGGNAEFPQPYIGRAFRNTLDGYMSEMDEDDGTMSAWYMFSQMGFYPTRVGTDKYEIFTPLFKKIVLNLPSGKVTIKRKCPEASYRIVLIDGLPLEGSSISHSQLCGAKEIIVNK